MRNERQEENKKGEEENKRKGWRIGEIWKVQKM